jgi:hypothetical protein
MRNRGSTNEVKEKYANKTGNTARTRKSEAGASQDLAFSRRGVAE